MDSPLLENIRSRHWKKKQKKPALVTIEEGKIPIRVTWPDSVTDICPLLSNLSWRRSVRHQSRYRCYLNSNNSSQTPSSLQISSQQQKHNRRRERTRRFSSFFLFFTEEIDRKVMASELQNTKSSLQKPPICVLDASSYLGFWILKGLLSRGYLVHAAVQSNGNCPSPIFLFIWDFLLWVFGFF